MKDVIATAGDEYNIDDSHDVICAYIVEQAVNLNMPDLARKTLTLFREHEETFINAQNYYDTHADK